MTKSTTKSGYPKYFNKKGYLYVEKHAGVEPEQLGGAISLKKLWRTETNKVRFIEFEAITQTGETVRDNFARSELNQPTSLMKHLLGIGWTAASTTCGPYLIAYFLKFAPTLTTKTHRVGWVGEGKEGFLWPKGKIDCDDMQYRFQPAPHAHNVDLSVGGKLKSWQDEVVNKCQYSNVLIFSLCVAAAAISRKKLSTIPGGGFHLFGGSSKGKTTSLQAAHSMVGKPETTNLFTWNATETGLEETAVQHQDLLLNLDDTSKLDSMDALAAANKIIEVAYQLSGRRTKNRSATYTKKSAAMQIDTDTAVDVIYLSNGERSTRAIVMAGGRSMPAGGEVRLVDIPIDNEGSPWGVFDRLPKTYRDLDCSEPEKSKKLVSDLHDAMEKYHGRAGRHFAKYIIEHPESAKQFADFVQEFQGKHDVSKATDGRIKDRFALVYAAGKLALQAGTLKPLTSKQIDTAVSSLYQAASRPVTKSVPSLNEDINALKNRVKELISGPRLDITSSLQTYGGFIDESPRYKGCVLFKNASLYNLVQTKSRIDRLIRYLATEGVLNKNPADGKNSIQYTIKGGGKPRFLMIKLEALKKL